MATLDSIGRYTGRRYFPALAYRDYRLLWTGILASDSATWALMTARAWLAKDMAQDHGNMWVGITIFAAMIPYIIFPPFAGYLADRIVRRHILTGVFVLTLVHSIVLTLLTLFDIIQMWQLVFLSFVNGSGRAIQTPTAHSLVANLVRREHMLNAYALNAATFHASKLIGPGLIAPLLAVADPGWVFLISNVGFVIGLYMVVRIRTVSTGVVEPTKGVFHNLLAGLRYTYAHRVLALIVVLIAFHCSLTMSFESLLPVMSDERFDWGGSGVAYLMMATGAGALAAALYLAGVRGERLRGRILLGTGVLSALTPLALAIAPNMFIGMLAAAGMGAAQTAYMVITLTMMQSMVPDGIRGRISSIYIIHAGGIMSFANLGNGTLADFIDPGWLLAVGGLAFLTVTLVSTLGPTMRRVYWSGIPPQVASA